MKITNFEHTGLDKIESWIERHKIDKLDEKTIKEALKTSNVFFMAEGINRVQSMLLCEIKASYIQQSQRYVTMQNDAFKLPKLEKVDNESAVKLVEKSYYLYKNMSELKKGEFTGRPKPENYRHMIPIEDARYILPLGTKTNICVAMTGDKLYDLFFMFNSKLYKHIFQELKQALTFCLPTNLVDLFPKVRVSIKDNKLLEELFLNDLQKIQPENNLILLNSFQNLVLPVGLGALTSTQSRTSSEILATWGDEANDKAGDVAKRVLGYGHESINEQARTTFGMMCSLAAYHQQIRHRLPEIYRESLLNIILEKDRPVLVPQCIKESGFHQKFLDVIKEYKDFRVHVYKKYGPDKALAFLLNCDRIKMIISTNARIDVQMLAERTCMNSQWEIRELAIKKLNILREKSNVLYEKALPSCITGKCKEGKFACGKQHEVKKLFTDK